MNLFLCKTPIQVLRAIQLTYYSVDDFENSEICIFNTFASAKKLSNNLKTAGIFNNVYFFENDHFNKGMLNYLRVFFNDTFKVVQSDISSITIFNIDSYDSFYFYNKLRKKVKVYYVEDAPMLYYYAPPSVKNRVFYGILGLQFPIFKVAKWYFSRPELMVRLNDAEYNALPIIDKNDWTFVEFLNSIFEYEPDEIVTNSDIIIMEESLYTDGVIKDNSDYTIYKQILERYQNREIGVKLHPRTLDNRFSKEFNIVKKSGIPWELYSLNNAMNSKIFISIACSTMVSSKLLFSEELKCILLYNLVKDTTLDSNGNNYFTETWLNNLQKIPTIFVDSSKIQAPNTLAELFQVMDKWLYELSDVVNECN